jgi:hypothetical protein
MQCWIEHSGSSGLTPVWRSGLNLARAVGGNRQYVIWGHRPRLAEIFGGFSPQRALAYTEDSVLQSRRDNGGLAGPAAHTLGSMLINIWGGGCRSRATVAGVAAVHMSFCGTKLRLDI